MNIDDIEEELKKVSSPYLSSYAKDDDERRWKFSLTGRKLWNISLLFPMDFPHSLPSAKLLDTVDVGTLAHVNRKCTICVNESDSIVIDTSNPSQIIEQFLEDVVKILNHSSMAINQDELTDEYEGYFVADTIRDVNSFYTAKDQLELISLNVIPEKSGYLYKQNHNFHAPILLLDNSNTYPADFSNVKKAISTTINIIHLPLNEPVLPPSNAEDVTAGYIERISKSISLENQTRLQKILEKTKRKKEFFVLISMPRDENERTQLLLHYTCNDDLAHPLIEYSEKWKIRLYSIQRNNKEYLLERGGAQESLLDKKVVVVGCGSVGSEIAFSLAKAGVGELTLIDNDSFEVDNIYRHRLGGDYLDYESTKRGYYKVEALKHAIQKDLPYVKVNSIKSNFEEVIEKEEIDDGDLIIISVGSPALNLRFNAALKQKEIKHILFCWNEAAGYGGHSVRLNLAESCLECLFTYSDGYSNACKLNFLEMGQKIAKNLTGCAGVFTPFSYLDSSQTAILAANQAIQLLLKKDSTSKAVSWRGNGSGTLNTTVKYAEAEMMQEVEIKSEELCKVCHAE